MRASVASGNFRRRFPLLLNLGSSSTEIREVVQPWIENQVFRPLRVRGVEVIHVDMRELPGVDVRADVTDPEDVRRYFRALRKAQRDIDLRPERYTHYYKKEFPPRFHGQMDTRRWGPGERLVFEPYTKEVYDETFKWIADHGIFADTGMGSGKYEESVIHLAQ